MRIIVEYLVDIANKIDRSSRRFRDGEKSSESSFQSFSGYYESFMDEIERSEFDLEVEKYFDVNPSSEKSVFSLERWIAGPRYDNFPQNPQQHFLSLPNSAS